MLSCCAVLLLAALEPALFSTGAQAGDVLLVLPDYQGPDAQRQGHPGVLGGGQQGKGQYRDQGQGAQRDEAAAPDDQHAGRAGEEQGEEGQRQEHADAGGHGLAAAEAHEAGEHMAQHAGQGHAGHQQGRKVQPQGQGHGQGALAQVTGQGQHAPAETAQAGHVGGAGVAAAVVTGIDAAEGAGDDQPPRGGTQHITQNDTQKGRHIPPP